MGIFEDPGVTMFRVQSAAENFDEPEDDGDDCGPFCDLCCDPSDDDPAGCEFG